MKKQTAECLQITHRERTVSDFHATSAVPEDRVGIKDDPQEAQKLNDEVLKNKAAWGWVQNRESEKQNRESGKSLCAATVHTDLN